MKVSPRCCLLIVAKNSWSVFAGGERQADESSAGNEYTSGELHEHFDSIVSAIKERQNSGRPIVLAVDADLCLAASIELPSPHLLRKPRLMHYQLEEWFPWSAEDYVSDFTGQRNRAFAVALETANLLALTERLEEDGISVAAISPLALLAVSGLQEQSRISKDCVVLWQSGSLLQLIRLENRKPSSWQQANATEQDLLGHLFLSQLDTTSALPLVGVNLAEQTTRALEKYDLQLAQEFEDSLLESGSRFGESIIAGKGEPFIELQQAPFAGAAQAQKKSWQLKTFYVATCVSVLIVSGMLWLKSLEFSKRESDVRAELQELYREAFPDKPVPARVEVTINEEHRRLKKKNATPQAVPSYEASDLVLESLLRSLPEGLRFRVPEIRVEQNRVLLGAEVRSNADADRIASSLRSGGFEVTPPRTRRLTASGSSQSGFGVRISGKLLKESETP